MDSGDYRVVPYFILNQNELNSSNICCILHVGYGNHLKVAFIGNYTSIYII